jgi:hypothetical protein
MEVSYCPWRANITWSTASKSDWTELQTTELEKPVVFNPKGVKLITDAIKEEEEREKGMSPNLSALIAACFVLDLGPSIGPFVVDDNFGSLVSSCSQKLIK